MNSKIDIIDIITAICGMAAFVLFAGMVIIIKIYKHYEKNKFDE